MHSLKIVFLALLVSMLISCSGGGGNNNNGDGGGNGGSNGGTNGGTNGGANGGSNGGTNGGTNGGANGGSNGGTNGGTNGGANGGSNGGTNGGTNGGANGGSNGGTNGGSNNTPPSLTAADKNTVSPCPDQSILTNETELTALKDALANGALSFRDVPFSGSDPDNFKKKCGLEGFWDPANNVNDITPANVGINSIAISQLLTNGNAGICATGALPTNNVTGFPTAGTYRTEIRTASGPSTWLLRLRTVASGSAAGNEFSQESIVVPSDIENTLEYKVNGVVTSHTDAFAAVINAVSTDGSAVSLDVSKSAGGPTVFSFSIELICVSKS